MNSLEKQVKEVLVEREYCTPKEKVKILNVTMQGEWGTIEVNCYKPRCKKPYKFHRIVVFIPSNTVFWSKSTFYYL